MSYDHLEHAGNTHVGRRRKKNEDSILLVPEAGLFVVADGMGGGSSGDVASARVVQDLEETSGQSDFPGSCLDKAKHIMGVVNASSKWIKDRAQRMNLSVSGSTVVMLVFDQDRPGRAVSLHAGDSRLYRLRGSELQRVTVDHSVEAAAGLDEDTVLPAMFRGIITRAVGVKDEVQLEVNVHSVKAGDTFLLCSDGLTNMVPDGKMEMILNRYKEKSLDELADVLIDEANTAGGVDNISAVLMRVSGEADFSQGIIGDEMETFPTDEDMMPTMAETKTLETIRDMQKLGHLKSSASTSKAKKVNSRLFIIAMALIVLALLLVILGK